MTSTRCSGRTYLGNHLSPSSWPIDSQDRWRDRTELESNPPTSQRARRQGDSSLAERTRQSSRGSGGRKKAKRPESETEIRSRLAREVEVLRRISCDTISKCQLWHLINSQRIFDDKSSTNAGSA